jgi:iron complex outermembrane receptor protein
VGGIGGSINVIPRRPSRTPEHAARLSAGSFNTYNAAFGTTGPVSDRISYRFDISRQTSKNHIDRGDSESTALAGSLAFTISDNLRATLLNEFGYIQPMTYNGLPMVNGVAQESLREENYATSDSRTYHKENSTRIDIDWTTNPTFSIRNVTSLLWGIRQWKMGPTELNYQPETNDILRSGYVIFDHDQFQWSNQFVATSRRTLGNRDNALSFGGEIEHIDLIHLVDTWPDVTSVVSLVDPEPGLYPTTPFTRVSGQNNLVYEYAGFVDDRLAVTPKLSVVGGVRYDVHQHDRTDLVTANHTVVSRTIHSLNGRVGLVYALRPNLNLYGQYSKASDVGAGLVGISAENLLRLDPTRGHQVEVGLKQSALAGRLEWTLAGYRILKKDLLIPDPERFNTFVQIGSQSSQGIEASATVNVGSSLRIAANGTVLNPQFEDFFELVDGVRTSRRGNRPSRIPVESANVMVTWTVPKWLAQGTLRHVGDRYINRANTLKLPAYTVVDASLRRTLTNQIAVDAKVSNVFDAFYPYNFVDNGRGGGSWMVGAQRAFSVVLTATF